MSKKEHQLRKLFAPRGIAVWGFRKPCKSRVRSCKKSKKLRLYGEHLSDQPQVRKNPRASML